MNDVDLRIELARLDERLKAVVRDAERAEDSSERALGLSSAETQRRLDILNHDHQNAVQDREKYAPREMVDVMHREMDGRISKLELNEREQRGRLWLPMIVIAAVVAAVAATAAKLLFP